MKKETKKEQLYVVHMCQKDTKKKLKKTVPLTREYIRENYHKICMGMYFSCREDVDFDNLSFKILKEKTAVRTEYKNGVNAEICEHFNNMLDYNTSEEINKQKSDEKNQMELCSMLLGLKKIFNNQLFKTEFLSDNRIDFIYNKIKINIYSLYFLNENEKDVLEQKIVLILISCSSVAEKLEEYEIMSNIKKICQKIIPAINFEQEYKNRKK